MEGKVGTSMHSSPNHHRNYRLAKNVEIHGPLLKHFCILLVPAVHLFWFLIRGITTLNCQEVARGVDNMPNVQHQSHYILGCLQDTGILLKPAIYSGLLTRGEGNWEVAGSIIKWTCFRLGPPGVEQNMITFQPAFWIGCQMSPLVGLHPDWIPDSFDIINGG
jgi:hypothetical protein